MHKKTGDSIHQHTQTHNSMERPRYKNTVVDDDDDSISWDELGDAINICRRESMETFQSNTFKRRSSNGSGHATSSATLPTIPAANRGSFAEYDGVAAAASAHCSTPHLGGYDDDDDFITDQFENRRHTVSGSGGGPVKLNHSMRSSSFNAGGAASSGGGASWDDLGDEIATALHQSMHLSGSLTFSKKSSIGSSSTSGHGSPKKGAVDDGPWNCPACTFLNENPLHLVCAVCGTAKAAKKLPPPPLPVASSSSSSRRQDRLSPISGSFISYPGDDLRASFNSQGSRGSSRRRDDMKGSFSSQSSRKREDLRGSFRSSSFQGRNVRSSGSRASLEGSFKSIGSEGDDSFGSYDGMELKFARRRGGDRGGLSHNISGSASLSSRNRRRTTARGRIGGGGGGDDMSRSSRQSVRSSKTYRKSTMMDFDGFDDASYGSDERTGGRIDGDHYDDEDDENCSDLSEDDTLYLDDNTVRTMQTIKTLRVPEGEVTIIYTDVQGSTSLWEADPISMKKATDIHDSIIRKCYADHGGYEITTEGDAFNLAFQHPADAIGFALKAQLQLYRAKWPEGILNHPDGCHNEKKAFRGFRVRFGMHHGPVTSTVHETTGRTIYQGEAVDVAKAIEKMSHGGQILTTVETWRAVSGMAEQFLGKPQVMDCGEHLLVDPKKEAVKTKKRRIISKRIVQLVPNQLAYDFFAARGGQEVKEGETPPRVCGRVFPPLLSAGQLSTSFLNAPYIGNRVAMVFVYTDKMESVTDNERKKNHKYLAKYIRSHLMRLSPPGYECQEDKGSWMLAFDRIESGIKFGLELKDTVVKSTDLRGGVDQEKLFRIGIHWGPFLSMGPHTISGHADYFGPIGEAFVERDRML